MKITNRNTHFAKGHAWGFNLVEALFAMAIVGVVFGALYSGIAWGFRSVQIARENLRATQVMLEKMEVIRVLTWSQLNSNGFIPVKFSAPYDPDPRGSGSGAQYQGTITITNAPSGTTYGDDLRLVRVKVSWKTGDQLRSRQMETYFSKYGVQNYIFEN